MNLNSDADGSLDSFELDCLTKIVKIIFPKENSTEKIISNIS